MASTHKAGTQGGTHEQHVKAGEQSHKNYDSHEKKATGHETSHKGHTGHTLTKDDEKKGGEHSHSNKK